MSEEQGPKSGSRWEPSPSGTTEPGTTEPGTTEPGTTEPAISAQRSATPHRPEDPDTEAIPRPDPAQDPEPAAHPGQAASAFGPDPWTPPVPEAPRPHRSRRRTGLLLAAAAAGLLALGGLAGYGIGQAAAGAGPTDAGTAAGAVAGYGHHRGPVGARGGGVDGRGERGPRPGECHGHVEVRVVPLPAVP